MDLISSRIGMQAGDSMIQLLPRRSIKGNVGGRSNSVSIASKVYNLRAWVLMTAGTADKRRSLRGLNSHSVFCILLGDGLSNYKFSFF